MNSPPNNQRSSSKSPPPGRLSHLDGLRGIAILLVILVHLGQRISGGVVFPGLTQYGQYGVQLFFVVSAYSLCLAHDRAHAGEPYLPFLVRRFWRIAPMYSVALAVFFLCTWWLEQHRSSAVFYTPTAEYTPGRVAANLLLVHGLVESANNNIVPGGWSIGCEFLFYGVFPLLFAAAARRLWFLGLMAVAAGAILASLQRAPGLTAHQGFLYYSLLCQLPCFLGGMAAYFWRKHRALGWVLAGLVPGALYGLYRFHNLSWGWSLTPVCAAVASAAALHGWSVSGAWSPMFLATLGRWSFSLYCLHYLFIRVVGDPLIQLLRTRGWPPDAIGCLVLLPVACLSILAARLTYARVEQPGITLGRTLARRLAA